MLNMKESLNYIPLHCDRRFICVKYVNGKMETHHFFINDLNNILKTLKYIDENSTNNVIWFISGYDGWDKPTMFAIDILTQRRCLIKWATNKYKTFTKRYNKKEIVEIV